uniref:Uncharacterized protein n=1 Tax=Ananas comosus var. bracteatus TaxID=296719 RepID=A0A6V7PRM1_ANACO|nr:unnamed protein product [Ananas comosus var. bracteatus]
MRTREKPSTIRDGGHVDGPDCLVPCAAFDTQQPIGGITIERLESNEGSRGGGGGGNSPPRLRLASALHALARALQPSSPLTLLRPRRHPSSTLEHGDVETQAFLLHCLLERRDVQHPPFFFFFLQEQHPPCRSTSPTAAAAEEAAAVTPRIERGRRPSHDRACVVLLRQAHCEQPPHRAQPGPADGRARGTEVAYCTSSGMSAIAAVLLLLVSAGGHIVSSKCLYGGTHALSLPRLRHSRHLRRRQRHPRRPRRRPRG